MDRRVFLSATAAFFLPLAKAQQGERDAATEIIKIVEQGYKQFSPGFIPDWIIQDSENARQAYESLRGFLQNPPKGGDYWRNGFDALGVIAGTNPEWGRKTMQDMIAYGNDDHLYFGQGKQDKVGDVHATPAAHGVKLEAPLAISFLAASALKARHIEVFNEAQTLLESASRPEFWNVQWADNGDYKPGLSWKGERERNLAQNAKAALQRLKPLLKVASNSRPAELALA